MQSYTRVYLKSFGLDESDFCQCETCSEKVRATDIHHILTRKKHPEGLNQIENIMAVCRECHNNYGDRIYLIPILFRIHRKVLQLCGVRHNGIWIKKQIEKYENLAALKEQCTF
ncbi:HNH endonuclease [Tenacibaculum sp. C7A-26P2]|uniref:HNH endonuclease n=1 Tax=Tenacibaculum sp. C7A-26P2 TaxID=3447504 RepID=UPI003F83CA75